MTVDDYAGSDGGSYYDEQVRGSQQQQHLNGQGSRVSGFAAAVHGVHIAKRPLLQQHSEKLSSASYMAMLACLAILKLAGHCRRCMVQQHEEKTTEHSPTINRVAADVYCVCNMSPAGR